MTGQRDKAVGRPPPARATAREWTGLAVIALPCMLYSMDLTVLNLAIPSISEDLKPTVERTKVWDEERPRVKVEYEEQIKRSAAEFDPQPFHLDEAAGKAELAAEIERVRRSFKRELVLYEPPMGGLLADETWIERYEAHIAAGERNAAVRVFMHDVGGYSHEELDEMEGTPLWQARLEVSPTAPRELRAEREFKLDGLGLQGLAVPCLLLVGSESPGWARRSTDAFAAAIQGAEVRTLEGQGHGATISAPELLAAELERLLPGVIESARDRDASA